jgi:hypothetical protein
LSALNFFGSEDGVRSYSGLVVDCMLEMRASGCDDFDVAWATAMRRNQPSFFWTRLLPGDQETPLDFFKRHCRASWFGHAAEKACQDCGWYPCTCVVVEFGAVA